MAKPKKYPPPVEQPFLQHLVELRDRLLRVVITVLLVFLGLFAFANDIYSYLAKPLMTYLPEGSSMIATEVASPFLTPFKLTLVLSIFIAVPVILYQLWMFIAPGLYKHEKKLIFPLMFSSTLLFFLGMAFAYFVVFPLVFRFLIGVAPQGVSVMTDISRYLDFVLKMFFAFGIAFEVPIATILVVWSGMTTAASLAAKRPYIIVGAFVFGMLLTPPDVISQTLLALPMWLLFELGLIMSRWYTKPKAEEEDTDEGSEQASTETAPEPTPPNNPGGGSAAGVSATSSTAQVSDEPASVNESGHQEYEPLTEAQMDAELDRIEAEKARAGETNNSGENSATDADNESRPAQQEESRATASERHYGDFRDQHKVDEDAHAKATADALEIARRARGEIAETTAQPVAEEEPTPTVYTEEDHQRVTEEAMAIARAAAGINPDPAPESSSDTKAIDAVVDNNANKNNTNKNNTNKNDTNKTGKSSD